MNIGLRIEMNYSKKFSKAFIAISISLIVLSSCSSNEDRSRRVGMALIGEASEKESSLSGEAKNSQTLEVNFTSTTLPVVPTLTTTTSTVLESIPIPDPPFTPTTSTTLSIETPDKPFYVATALHENIEVFKKQNDKEARWLLSNPGPFDGERVLLIRSIEEDWVQVSMPIRPHGTKAWVKRETVSIMEHKAKVIIDKYTGILEGWQNGQLLFKDSFEGGSEENPTPLGDFYINEITDTSDGVSEKTLVGTTAYSTTIDIGSQGAPAIAFLAREVNEGTSEVTTRGCIRVSQKVLSLLAALPLGTPVQIVG